MRVGFKCEPALQSCFDEQTAGWTVFAGLRPVPYLGVELQYIDFGHTAKIDGEGTNSNRARALALFGTGTLPLPFVDLYAKAGVGRLQTKTSSLHFDPMACLDAGLTGPACDLFGPRNDTTKARFGWGLGVQLKLSSVALRAEYVRFSVPTGDPDLLSIALL